MSGSPPFGPSDRRDAILAAALDLFRQRGFHSVGVDDIGTAAGISGPGVYRHFSGKSSLLVALFEKITERMLLGAEEIQKADCSPAETLDRLVAYHVSTAVEERALVAVWLHDRRSLPADDEERIRRRQAEYVAIWLAALTRVRPELAPAEAEVLVHAALGAAHSVALHDAGPPDEELQPLLVNAVRAALGAGGPRA